MSADTTTQVYEVFIRTTPEKLWSALTSGKLTKEYCFGRRIESDWSVGSPVVHRQPDGTIYASGTVLEYNPPRRLSYSWPLNARCSSAFFNSSSKASLRW